MITKLNIKNFKSIKELELDSTRVNVFIGEPNTGKSNILESIGILSFGYTTNLRDFVRYEKNSNLFYNDKINKDIRIQYTIDKDSTILEWDVGASDFHPKHNLKIEYNTTNRFVINSYGGDFMNCDFNLTYDNENGKFIGSHFSYEPYVRFFRFKDFKFEKPDDVYTLKPPDGNNLMNVLRTNENVRQFAVSLIEPFNLKLRLKEDNGKIELTKEIENVIFDSSFELLSDTFIKMIILYAAIETSKKHTLVLEEPEAHVFPFYNKFLAERIALYNTNQFFIATHNPTFLANIIEQTPDKELKVFITYYEDYQTKVFELSGEKLRKAYKIFGTGIFGNMEKIVKGLDIIIKKEEEEHI